MIVDERLVTYINSLDRGNTPVLDEIEKEALRDFVPIIRKEMQSFLKLLLAMQKPMRILEVGTAVGFSAVLMAEYAPKGCQIVTMENYEKRIPIAKANFERAGKQEQITLLEGDATEILPQLEGQFDMIFMDAAKGQYINFMPQVLRLLKTGGASFPAVQGRQNHQTAPFSLCLPASQSSQLVSVKQCLTLSATACHVPSPDARSPDKPQ